MIWQLAGLLGVDPGPLTLRELVWMAEARLQAEWAQTSSVMALIANANRDPKKHGPFKPGDFDPTQKAKHEPVVEKADIGVLKQVFIDRNDPQGGNQK